MRVDELISITIGKTDAYALEAKDALISLSSLNPDGEDSYYLVAENPVPDCPLFNVAPSQLHQAWAVRTNSPSLGAVRSIALEQVYRLLVASLV